MPADQQGAAQALGSYVRGCYGAGKAVASGAGSAGPNGTVAVTIRPPKPSAVDRVQIREDQSLGQLVRQFRLVATLADGTTAALCPGKGSSIGNKYICVLGSAVTVASITLHAVGAAGTQPRIAQFAAFSCGGVAAEIDAAWDASRH